MWVAALAAASAQCAPVHVVVAKGMPAAFSAKLVERTSKNFQSAYAKACVEHFLRKPLIDAAAKDKRLILTNAPNANAASIYLNSGRMLLEYPFVSEGGKTEVPSLQQLLEAIYCAAHGASAKEQEESGRCLPD
jgi:hypothetical protein